MSLQSIKGVSQLGPGCRAAWQRLRQASARSLFLSLVAVAIGVWLGFAYLPSQLLVVTCFAALTVALFCDLARRFWLGRARAASQAGKQFLQNGRAFAAWFLLIHFTCAALLLGGIWLGRSFPAERWAPILIAGCGAAAALIAFGALSVFALINRDLRRLTSVCWTTDIMADGRAGDVFEEALFLGRRVDGALAIDAGRDRPISPAVHSAFDRSTGITPASAELPPRQATWRGELLARARAVILPALVAMLLAALCGLRVDGRGPLLGGNEPRFAGAPSPNANQSSTLGRPTAPTGHASGTKGSPKGQSAATGSGPGGGGSSSSQSGSTSGSGKGGPANGGTPASGGAAALASNGGGQGSGNASASPNSSSPNSSPSGQPTTPNSASSSSGSGGQPSAASGTAAAPSQNSGNSGTSGSPSQASGKGSQGTQGGQATQTAGNSQPVKSTASSQVPGGGSGSSSSPPTIPSQSQPPAQQTATAATTPTTASTMAPNNDVTRPEVSPLVTGPADPNAPVVYLEIPAAGAAKRAQESDRNEPGKFSDATRRPPTETVSPAAVPSTPARTPGRPVQLLPNWIQTTISSNRPAR